MSRLKKIIRQPRVIILIIALVIAFLSINYQFSDQGLIINSVETNSSAFNAGIRSPTQDISLTNREKIISVNNQEIKELKEYNEIINSISIDSNIRLKTDKTSYVITKDSSDVGLTISKAPSSNLRKGIDLQGGTRVILEPAEEISKEQIKDIMATMEKRLNVYGLSDLVIKSASDLEGNKFIIVELAGVSKEELRETITKQGSFEARIGNKTAFTGKEVKFVCRAGGSTCLNQINPVCPKQDDQSVCRFEFEIHLNEDAAERHKKITDELKIIVSPDGQRMLDQKIDFYLDGQLVDSLNIDADLKGISASRITITGSGSGSNQQEAVKDALKNKEELQTFLITGSLPTKLNIVKIDTLSPSLGEVFVKNALLIGLISIFAVASIIIIRYKKLKISIPIIITMISEVLLTLGIASIFKYNLDLAAIAGIIAAVGTGVNDQIVIIDEVLFGNKSAAKQSIKNAFFVILAAFATIVAAMLPLLRAGAGLLTGFAITTIIGVTVGVLITRPFFGVVIRILFED